MTVWRGAAIAVVALVFTGCDDSAPSSSAPKAGVPVSASELQGLARSLHQPVYWAGAQGGGKLELTRSGSDRIYVRYVSGLTVATYRSPRAFVAVTRSGRAPGGRLYELPGRSRAAVQGDGAASVHLAYRSRPYEVEVSDPKPGRALNVVLGRQIRAVEPR